MINRKANLAKDKTVEIKEFPIVFGSHEVKLKGKVLFPLNANTDSPIPGAVLCHGFGANYKAVEPSARIMSSQGVATLIFDFRGHGSSDGVVDGKMGEDIVDAWNFLSRFPGVNRKRMGLIGHSMGAMTAIVSAERLNNPRVLVALSCPSEIENQLSTADQANISHWGHNGSSITEYPKHGAFPWLKGIAAFMCRVWMYIFGYRVRVNWQKFIENFPRITMSEVLQKLNNCSKLFVFCEGDKVTPYQKSMFAFEAATGPKKMILAKGGFHTTPLLPGNLRSQWTSWAVETLTAQ